MNLTTIGRSATAVKEQWPIECEIKLYFATSFRNV